MSFSKLLLLGLLVVSISACESSVQNTSGKEYLANHASISGSQTKDAQSFQQKLHDAANIEPTLKFPARIGIARVDTKYGRGNFSAIPPEEMEHWTKLSEALGKEVGQFIPVSGLVLATLKEAEDRDTKTENTVQQIRLASARQHLDAVLIYEVSGKETRDSNILKVADLTVLGMFIFPSQELKSDALAGAALIDVMNGYPYAQTSASFSQEEFSTSWGRESSIEKLQVSSKAAAVEKLTKNIEKLFQELRTARSEKK